MNYDLENRTAKFGEDTINFVKNLPYNQINKPLISQIVRSATSIGANYMEANQASSKKDFRNKIAICKKESNETKHWLRMIAVSSPDFKEQCQFLWKGAHELVLIFGKIMSSCDNKDSKLKN